jgi:hypothetical protein
VGNNHHGEKVRPMRIRAREENGVVAINLVLVLSFALFAVIMLTNTTVKATQIDDRVKKIRGEVGQVDTELTNVPQLDQTAIVAGEIDVATKNLDREAGDIVTSAKSIDRTVSSILSNATSINGTVGSINSTLGSIQGVVRSIDGGSLGSRFGAAGINTRLADIRRSVGGIKSDTGSILAQVGLGHGGPGGNSIHGHANSIDCSPALTIVAGSNCGIHP